MIRGDVGEGDLEIDAGLRGARVRNDVLEVRGWLRTRRVPLATATVHLAPWIERGVGTVGTVLVVGGHGSPIFIGLRDEVDPLARGVPGEFAGSPICVGTRDELRALVRRAHESRARAGGPGGIYRRSSQVSDPFEETTAVEGYELTLVPFVDDKSPVFAFKSRTRRLRVTRERVQLMPWRSASPILDVEAAVARATPLISAPYRISIPYNRLYGAPKFTPTRRSFIELRLRGEGREELLRITCCVRGQEWRDNLDTVLELPTYAVSSIEWPSLVKAFDLESWLA